jgi:hypothetical protein
MTRSGAPPAGLDPALPALAPALDPSAVALRFQRRWPGPGEPPAIRGCLPQHRRWAPGVECEAVYLLTTSLSPVPTIGVVRVRPEGVSHRLYTDDPGLEGLAAATDPARMRAWLAERLGGVPDTCTVVPVSYRPQLRCMLRYQLGGGAGPVYAKVVSSGAFEALAAAAAALGGELAPPLVGVAPEWRLVAQADAGGHSLRSLAVDPPPPGAAAQLRAAGRLLARLHARSGPPGETRSLSGDAAALRHLLPVVESALPASAAGFVAAAGRLAAIGDGEAPAPAHGALRLDQVHLGSAGAALIDLDSYCWAEPARDLGNLLAYLRWREIRRPAAAAALAGVRAALLEGHAEEWGAAVDPGRIALHQAASSLKIAGRCLQKLAVAEWAHLPRLVDVALDGLGGGAGPVG